MSYKYPYIPKEYYAATMFACKLIREYGTFNRAISTAAGHYDVNEDELAKHVRARQAAGQKGKKRGKMQWFIVFPYSRVQYRDNYDEVCMQPERFQVRKAKNEENANWVSDRYGFGFQNESYSTDYRTVISGPYETRREAEEDYTRVRDICLRYETLEQYLADKSKGLIPMKGCN